ncbi:unnamed protein product [Ectocarpus sp. CCAP 1310/34]|nr:unnamed protein product [Ectocarpus sp. CCAP 1310/34]
MSRFFKDNSPAKKAKPEQTSDGAGSGGFKTVGEVYPGLVCPLDQKVLLKKYTKTGRPWIVCSGNVQNDPDSCHFSANLFGRDRVKEGDKSKIACQICDVPAEFTPSIGEPTGEKNPLTGKPVFENTHVFFPHCWGKQTEDPVSGKSLLVHCTAATGAVVGVDHLQGLRPDNALRRPQARLHG